MILRPAQIRQMRMGLTVTPANFGGDSESDSSTSTRNDTTNYATSTDKRAVASDQAVSLTGDYNTIDRSTSNTTQFFDSSNRSSTSLTSFLDQSNRSTNFTDNSDRSVTTVNTMTDYGSVSGGLSLADSMTKRALDLSGNSIGGAIDVLKLQTKTGADSTAAAFDLARASGANSLSSSAAVLGFANSAIRETADAFAQAKDGGQSKMVMAAIGAVAVVGIAFALNR